VSTIYHSVLDPRAGPLFIPFYLQRRVVPRRAGQPAQDSDITAVRTRLASTELAVKAAEAAVRSSEDYRHVLAYFSASSELHTAAVSCSWRVTVGASHCVL
jgi:hypothetical protein